MRKGIIVADDAATFELKVGTYRYFKDIEADHLGSGLFAEVNIQLI